VAPAVDPVPAAQGAHGVAALIWYVFAGHVTHETWPVAVATAAEPGVVEQAVQLFTAAPPEAVPAGHGEHTDWPWSANWPGAQGAQTAAPAAVVPALMLPAGQVAHAEAETAYWPGVQTTVAAHVRALGAALIVPHVLVAELSVMISEVVAEIAVKPVAHAQL